MPLLKGKANIGKNITELEGSAKQRSRKQILAIALSTAKEGNSPGAKLKRLKKGK